MPSSAIVLRERVVVVALECLLVDIVVFIFGAPNFKPLAESAKPGSALNESISRYSSVFVAVREFLVFFARPLWVRVDYGRWFFSSVLSIARLRFDSLELSITEGRPLVNP